MAYQQIEFESLPTADQTKNLAANHQNDPLMQQAVRLAATHDTHLIKTAIKNLLDLQALSTLNSYVEDQINQHDLRGIVSIYGSARLQEDHPDYQLSAKFGGLLAAANFAAITGGATGIMTAAFTQMAEDYPKFAVRLKGLLNERANAYVPDKAAANALYFIFRRWGLIRDYTVAANGGLGTLDEVFDVVLKMEQGFVAEQPVVFLHSNPGILELFNTFNQSGDELKAIMHETSNPEDALEIIETFGPTSDETLTEFPISELEENFERLVAETLDGQQKTELEQGLFGLADWFLEQDQDLTSTIAASFLSGLNHNSQASSSNKSRRVAIVGTNLDDSPFRNSGWAVNDSTQINNIGNPFASEFNLTSNVDAYVFNFSTTESRKNFVATLTAMQNSKISLCPIVVVTKGPADEDPQANAFKEIMRRMADDGLIDETDIGLVHYVENEVEAHAYAENYTSTFLSYDFANDYRNLNLYYQPNTALTIDQIRTAAKNANVEFEKIELIDETDESPTRVEITLRDSSPDSKKPARVLASQIHLMNLELSNSRQPRPDTQLLTAEDFRATMATTQTREGAPRLPVSL